LRTVFQHRQIIVDRFPIAAADRFTRRVPINAPICEHLRNLCFCIWPFFTASDFQMERSHELWKDLDHLVFRFHTRNVFPVSLFCGGFRFVVGKFDVQREKFFENLFVR
jgi:hypothetical protein